MSFSSLGLTEVLLRAVAREGYENPTPIQSRAIPMVLEGHDLLAAAQTGTGKTAAFTLPLLQKLAAGTSLRQPRALVLTPTRELAAQVAESVATYGREVPLRHAVIFGGVGYQPQVDALRRGVDLIIATPGRLLEHIAEGNADLSKIEFFVLDEADRMLDMGFIRDIRRVLKVLPAKRQNLLFSATFSEDIRSLAKTFLHAPSEIDIAPRNATVETVEQRVVFVDQKNKRQLLSHLIHGGGWKQVLVFARMKHGANRLCEYLAADGLPSAALHGNKSQSARTRALADFKAGRIRVLVATDIAARGIDIDQLPHVINFELPNVPEDYVHRIGRTGRAGNEGEALSLVAADERPYLRDIQKLIKREIPVMALPADFEPRALPPEPPRPPRPPNNGRRSQSQKPAQRSAPRTAQPSRQAPHDDSRPEPGNELHPPPRGTSQRPAGRGAPQGRPGGGAARNGRPGGGRPGSARPGGGNNPSRPGGGADGNRRPTQNGPRPGGGRPQGGKPRPR